MFFLNHNKSDRYIATLLACVLAASILIPLGYGYLTAQRNKAALATELEAQQFFFFPEEREFFVRNAESRVVVLEYFDLDCPYCKIYHQTGEGYIVGKYGGSVSFARRHMPLSYLHPNARYKAEILECVAREHPNLQEEALSVLYAISFENIEKSVGQLATQLAIDREPVTQCATNNEQLEVVKNAILKGAIGGIVETPTFVVYKDGVERARIRGNNVARLDSAITLLLKEK